MSFRDLVRRFELSAEEEEDFRDLLDQLERKAEIARVRGEKYSAIEHSNLTAGRLTVRPEGFGFVLVDGGPDLFVPRAGMHGAMDGDTVLAREERPRSRGRGRALAPEKISGTVVKVLDRARERVVGRHERSEGSSLVTPYDPRIDAVIRVPDGKARGARTGEIVEVRLT